MKDAKQEEFLRDIEGSDMDFYDKFLIHLSDEELQKFLDENPEFKME